MKVLLDANFLVYCAAKKIDYVVEISNLMPDGYELAVPVQVVQELEKMEINARKYRDKMDAKLALQLLRFNKIKILKISGKDGDEALINASEGNIVATVDFDLRKKVPRAIVMKRDGNIAFD